MDNNIYFDKVEDYNKPNIHDLDPYDALQRSIISTHAESQEKEREYKLEYERKLPDSIKITSLFGHYNTKKNSLLLVWKRSKTRISKKMQRFRFSSNIILYL